MNIIRKNNNFIQLDNRQQKHSSVNFTAPQFNYAQKDIFEKRFKQNISFAGFFDFFKKQKVEITEPVPITEQPDINEEEPVPVTEQPEIIEEEPEITSLEDIRGPYVETPPERIKYIHNKRLKENLTPWSKIPEDKVLNIGILYNEIKKLCRSDLFDPDIKIFLDNDEEEASIFDDLKYYNPEYAVIILAEMFGKDDKPVDEKHKLSYEFIKPLLGKFNKLAAEEPEMYHGKVLNFYKKQLDFDKPDEMITDGIKDENYDLLILLKENGISGDTLIPQRYNPDKKISFAEAAALSGNKSIRKLFPLAQALNNSVNRVTDGDTQDAKKIIDVIKRLPIDEFTEVINDLDNYDNTKNSGDKILFILEKINDCNEEEFNKLKPFIDSCFFKPCEKISKEKAISSNDWVLRQFLNENPSPKPYVVDYFRNNILNNPNIDINYKGSRVSNYQAHSVLEIALMPYYNDPIFALDFIAEIMLKGADTVDFKTDVSKDIYENIKDYRFDKIEEKFAEKILENPNFPQRASILNFLKQYYAANGKSSFLNISNNYEYAKLLMEAGVKPETKDSHNRYFIEFAKSLADKNGYKLVKAEEVIKSLINLEKTEALREYIFMEMFERSNDKKHFYKLQDIYINFYNILDTNKDKYNGYIISLGKSYLKNEFKSVFNEFYKNNLTENQIEYIFQTTSSEAKSTRNKSDYEAKKFFTSVYYDNLDYKNKEKYLNKIVELGIADFSLPTGLLEKASKMGLDKFFDEHPDLKDGIYTLDDFMTLCKSEDFCRYEGFNIPINEQNETLIDMFINIPAPEGIKQKTFFIDRFNDKPDFINWNHTDKFGNNYALKAVEAENIFMLKILQEKNIDFTARNKFGKNAIEVAKVSPNPIIREMFSNIKINSEEFTRLAKMGSVAGMEMLLKQDYIDVNSKDQHGLNSWLISGQQNKANVADFLRTNPKVDFSAKTKDGDNFAMTAVFNNSKDIITEIFPKLTPEQLDINYINTTKKSTVYNIAERFASPEIFKLILSLKSANPNICTDEITPVAFDLITCMDKERFKILCESGKLDTSAKFLNLSLQDYIKTHMMPTTQQQFKDNLSLQKEFLEILKVAVDKKFEADVRKIVDENGLLTLQNIKEFLEYPDIKNIIQSSLSGSQERIGHLLTDIEVTPENMFDILNTTQKILNLDKNAFTYRDKFGQSAIERALLAENEIVYEIITQNSALTSFDIEKLQKIALGIKNPKIKAITARLKPTRRSDDYI